MKQSKKEDVFYRAFVEGVKVISKENQLKLPSTNPTNPMRGITTSKKYLIQPHNYRLYFTFDKATFNPTQPYYIKNYNSEYHFINFYGCNIIVRKKFIEVINLWHQKQWRLIEAQSREEIDKRIDEIKEAMKDTCIKAVTKFIDIYGGNSDLIPIEKRKPEIGIHGDDYIDKIPKDMIIHDTTFKKVYKDKTEMYGFANVKNYITSRTKEDFIGSELEELKKYISPLKYLKTTCNSIQDIINNKEVINLLSEKEKKEISNWTFDLAKNR